MDQAKEIDGYTYLGYYEDANAYFYESDDGFLMISCDKAPQADSDLSIANWQLDDSGNIMLTTPNDGYYSYKASDVQLTEEGVDYYTRMGEQNSGMNVSGIKVYDSRDSSSTTSTTNVTETYSIPSNYTFPASFGECGFNAHNVEDTDYPGYNCDACYYGNHEGSFFAFKDNEGNAVAFLKDGNYYDANGNSIDKSSFETLLEKAKKSSTDDVTETQSVADSYTMSGTDCDIAYDEDKVNDIIEALNQASKDIADDIENIYNLIDSIESNKHWTGESYASFKSNTYNFKPSLDELVTILDAFSIVFSSTIELGETMAASIDGEISSMEAGE